MGASQCYVHVMTKTRRKSKPFRINKPVGRIGAGKLAHVKIARPRIQPENVDMKAVRKALREYFLTNPHALE
jgi:hypothetical protein